MSLWVPFPPKGGSLRSVSTGRTGRGVRQTYCVYFIIPPMLFPAAFPSNRKKRWKWISRRKKRGTGQITAWKGTFLMDDLPRFKKKSVLHLLSMFSIFPKPCTWGKCLKMKQEQVWLVLSVPPTWKALPQPSPTSKAQIKTLPRTGPKPPFSGPPQSPFVHPVQRYSSAIFT